jgi:hypothetical protein
VPKQKSPKPTEYFCKFCGLGLNGSLIDPSRFTNHIGAAANGATCDPTFRKSRGYRRPDILSRPKLTVAEVDAVAFPNCRPRHRISAALQN